MPWDIEPTNLMLKVEDEIVRIRNAKAEFGLRMLIRTTNRDTGKAVGLWFVQLRNERKGRGRLSLLGSDILSGVKSAASYVKRLIFGEEKSMRTGEKALAEGLKAIRSTEKAPYAEIAMVNKSEYIHHVNNGTRYIRPYRFVEKTMNAIRVHFT